MFEHVECYPGDPILSLLELFNKDPRPGKVNLGIGFYFDEEGRTPVLSSIRKAEAMLAALPLRDQGPRLYLPIEGEARFREANQRLLFGGEHEALQSQRVATIQTIGGSGALKIGADFLRQAFPASEVWLSSPTWENHRAVFEGAGFAVHDYPYYDPTTRGLRFGAMLATLEAIPSGSIVLLHPCCHNPTGVDLDREQWRAVLGVAKRRSLIPFADLAYQGFGEGFEQDAWAIRELARTRVSFLVANSFSKNLSLYGERCGGLSVVCQNREEQERVLGQLKATVRRSYSSPPGHGSQLAGMVLTDDRLREEWMAEVGGMRGRLQEMRRALRRALEARLPGHDFSFLTEQRGMFSQTGLASAQVDWLREHHAVYLVRSGRLCLAGLNRSNLERVAASLALVYGSALEARAPLLREGTQP